jgi:hypothetical protein
MVVLQCARLFVRITLLNVTTSRLTCCMLAATLLTAPGAAQQETSGARAGWPCGARMDPTYFSVAEATGGHLLLVAPEELADSAALLAAFGEHKQTIFRLAGAINPGVHEFRVPIEASVESVLFSVSIQCLQMADILDPSSTPVHGTDVTDLSNFRAERMVIVKRPQPGLWTIRAAGNGIGGVMVQARSELGIGQVRFAAVGSASFSPVPVPGVENLVRIELRGKATGVEASLVDAASRTIRTLPVTPGDSEGTFLSRFTADAAAFRIQVEGKDASGTPFRRVHAPLFTAR